MSQSTTKSLLESLKTDHDELLDEVANVKQFWMEVNELGQGPKFEEMSTRVHLLRERLRKHFADEEQGGYLAPVVRANPQMAAKVEELKREHAEFLGALDRFSEQLQIRESAFHNWEEVHKQVEEFLTRLHNHESAEMALMRKAGS